MIGTHGHAGQWEKAEAVWHQMVGAGCQPGPTAYVGLIDAYSHHGMYMVGGGAHCYNGLGIDVYVYFCYWSIFKQLAGVCVCVCADLSLLFSLVGGS